MDSIDSILLPLIQNLRVTNRPDWHIVLASRDGTRICDVFVPCRNSYAPDEYTQIRHSRIVPPASYNQRTWMVWLRDWLVAIEAHEINEGFALVIDPQSDHSYLAAGRRDGLFRPFAPHHGDGEDPYGTFQDPRLGAPGDAFTRPGQPYEPSTVNFAPCGGLPTDAAHG